MATQKDVQDARKRAAAWAKELKFREAALDLVSLPFLAIGWIVGSLWYLIKYLVGLGIEGFRSGARSK